MPQRVLSRAGVARRGVGCCEGRLGWGAHPLPAARLGSGGGDFRCSEGRLVLGATLPGSPVPEAGSPCVPGVGAVGVGAQQPSDGSRVL